MVTVSAVRAHPLRTRGRQAFPVPAPGIDGVVPADRVPEDDVVGIELGILHQGLHHRLLLEMAPAQAVGRSESVDHRPPLPDAVTSFRLVMAL